MISNTEKLVKALAKAGTHTAQDLGDAVAAGTMQVFAVNDSVLFTQVLDFPRMRVVEFFLAVGTMADMPDLERQATEFAVSIGAKRIRTLGRRGWNPSLTGSEGWYTPSTVWHKDL